MQTVIYLMSNAVHMYAFFILNRSILGNSRHSKRYEIVSYLLYYAFNCSAYLFMNYLIINLLSNIIPMFIIMLQYSKSIKTYCFLTFGTCAVGMLIDWLLFCIMPTSFLLNSNVPQSIAFLAIVFLFRHYFSGKERINVDSSHIIILILVSLGTIVIANLSGPEFNFKCLVISVILLIINFLNFYLYDQL